MHVNAKYKDTLYRLIFKDKENLLSLYNALNHSDYTKSEDLEIRTLEDVVYMSYKNDVSFLIYDDLFLVEHQSSVNPNMVLRSFLYFAKMYQSIVDCDDKNTIYSSSVFKIPTPKSFVMYNGIRNKEEKEIQRLSAHFINKDDSGDFEWTTTVFNINDGYNKELIDKCPPLKDYMHFVNKVNKAVKAGTSANDAIDMAIDECIHEGILVDILKKQKAEVKDVCLTEFNQEKYERILTQQGFEKGIEQGKAEMIFELKKEGFSVEVLAKASKLSIEQIERIIKEHNQ